MVINVILCDLKNKNKSNIWEIYAKLCGLKYLEWELSMGNK